MERMLDSQSVVCVRARSWTCALPIEDAIETMRALPIEPVTGVPDFCLGIAIVRGKPVPVLDLAAFLGARRNDCAGRFLAVRAGSRQVMLAVDDVIGVSRMDLSLLQCAPPLLHEALPADVHRLGVLDGAVLAVLQAGRLVSDDVWQKVTEEGVAWTKQTQSTR